MAESLDAALKERLRAVLDREPVTEAELRTLVEQGHACALVLGAQLARDEQRLGALSSDPSSSLSEIAETLRSVNELRPDVEELGRLLEGLEGRARELRGAWLSTS